MSLLMPEMPSRPTPVQDVLDLRGRTAEPLNRYSTRPDRARPGAYHAQAVEGGEPSVLSMLRPARSAHRLAPLPRWATMTRPAAIAGATSGSREAMYSYESPWSRSAAVRSPGARGAAARAPRRGLAARKLVSKQATCGTPGARSATASMAARLCGWCSGASGSSSRRPASTSGVMRTGAAWRGPPCTTRWPTPRMSAPPNTSPSQRAR